RAFRLGESCQRYSLWRTKLFPTADCRSASGDEYCAAALLLARLVSGGSYIGEKRQRGRGASGNRGVGKLADYYRLHSRRLLGVFLETPLKQLFASPFIAATFLVVNG